MSLKASFFNKSIFKTDMKRYWWLGFLEILVLIGIVVIPIYEKCTNNQYMEYYSYGNYAPRWMNGSFLLLIIFALSITVVLLSYMHFSSSVSGHHSIPVTRKTLLSTKLISAVVLVVTPIIINGIIMLALLNNNGFYEFYTFMDILKWIVRGVLYSLMIISLTTAVNMMTGNPIGSLVFTVGFIILPGVIIFSFSEFLDMEVFGYVSSNIENVLNFIYIAEKSLLTVPYVFVYPLLIVLLTFGAFRLYSKRKLEAHGEVIAFKWLVPVFIGIISIFASIISYIYFIGILEKDGILYLLPLGCLGTVIAWMVSRKSLSLKGVFKPLGIYILVGLIFCAIFYFDLTGYERRIPDTDEVECVLLMSHEEQTVNVDGRKIRYYDEGKKDLYFRDTEDINNVRVLHKYLVDNRKARSFDNYTTLPIEYTLKNGKKLRRVYRINTTLDAQILKPVYETEQMKGTLYKLADGSKKEYMRILIRDRRVNNNESLVLYPDNTYLSRFTDAIIKDIENLKYEEFMLDNYASTSVEVVFKTNRIYEEPVSVDNHERYEYYAISSAYKNTKKVLEEMGYHIPTAEEIEGATIATWDGEAYYSSKVLSEKEQKITNTINPEEIAGIYAVYDSMIDGKKYTNYETCKNIKIAYRLKTGKTFEVSCSYDEDKIPDVLRKYF